MRVALALVAMTAPAFADETDPVSPPTPPATSPPSQTIPAPVPSQGPPGAQPAVDPAYGERSEVRRNRDIVVKYRAERSRQNITTVALLGGAGLLFGGVGLYFHFDSRSATDDVKADSYSGRTWTPDREDTFDRAHRSAALAGVGYGIGGAFLIATAVMYMATEPPLEEIVIHSHTDQAPVTMVTPLPGGAFVSRGWEF
jgi:hypothetical protein